MLSRFMFITCVLTLFAVSCGKHHDKGGDHDYSLDEVRAIAAQKLNEMGRDEFGFVAGCDGLTFTSLLDAFTEDQIDIYQARDGEGRWYRHPRKDCFLTGASISSISRDGFLMLFHALHARRDMESLVAIKDYAEKNNWIMGDGPHDYVWLAPFAPLLYELIDATKLTKSFDLPYFKGFRGHLVAMYIYLRAKLHGSINDVEMAALEILVKENANNPLFLALLNRFNGGDQGVVIEMLADFPTGDSPFDWGSAPNAVYYNLILAILEGK